VKDRLPQCCTEMLARQIMLSGNTVRCRALHTHWHPHTQHIAVQQLHPYRIWLLSSLQSVGKLGLLHYERHRQCSSRSTEGAIPDGRSSTPSQQARTRPQWAKISTKQTLTWKGCNETPVGHWRPPGRSHHAAGRPLPHRQTGLASINRPMHTTVTSCCVLQPHAIKLPHQCECDFRQAASLRAFSPAARQREDSSCCGCAGSWPHSRAASTAVSQL